MRMRGYICKILRVCAVVVSILLPSPARLGQNALSRSSLKLGQLWRCSCCRVTYNIRDQLNLYLILATTHSRQADS